MNIVTGGAGFIGAHLVDHLLACGDAVRVIERPGADVDHLPKDRIEIAYADIRDRESVRKAVQGAQRVYHLAANPNLWTPDRRDFDAVNHQGTVHVLEESLAAGAERVVHTSTESILTSPRFTGGKVETLELKAEDMVGPYCLSKFRAEEVALSMARSGKPVVVVNPTLPIGPGDRGMSPPTRMTLAACRGELPAYIEGQFNMIDARDVAAGMRLAMEKGRPGRRYLLGFQNMSLGDWLKLVGKETGRKPPTRTVPYWLALGVAHISEFIADYITHKMPQATVTGVKLTRYCMHFDPSESLAELGLQPRPVDESLHDAVAWYKQVGWM